ncbi:FAD-dependent thymidylate synthase [Pseudomonas sp. Sample_16]|uniref:FAD-dependent thymidylate synthase n=1 Tax=Pseudomonas sp. Sample_16 TaxID=2448263 RepID=UPI0010328C77|nr:FAD-dependent thymidylate synthase [Pseudomonas sp. Sample_16]
MKAQYVDHMGSDLSVVNAARVSFDKTSEWDWIDDDLGGYPVLKDVDARLIRYLARHNHWTPFAHTSVTLRMQAPVPIRTQCFKHKQGLVENEESRRYINSTPELYVPSVFRSKPEGSAKQGSAGDHPRSHEWRQQYRMAGEFAIRLYEDMIRDGVCPEQARFVLPQGCEVNWIWTGNVYAFANFYLKRTDPHAQQEIQRLAHEVGSIIEPLFPITWAALTRLEESTSG